MKIRLFHKKRQKKATLPAFLLLYMLCSVGILVSGCSLPPSSSPVSGPAAEGTDVPASAQMPATALKPSPSPVSTPQPTEEPFQEYDITLMALGDNLMHMGIVNTGREKDGTYDYTFLFENLTEYIDTADIRVINQETIFGGNSLGFSGFPYFNSPTEVGDAIAAAGFNVVLHATNHAADQGLAGIENCAAFWAGYPDILMTGISGEEPADRIPLLTVDDVTFAVLNYTYGPNMGTLPSSLKGHLNLLCACDEKNGAIDFTSLNPQVIEDIKEAKNLADIVLVFPHWGTEYQSSPSSYQTRFANAMAEAGADVIIGTHPHVPQPIEWITAENGHRTLCYYSLGNYVSTQKQAKCMLEEMAWVTFHVTEDQVTVEEENSGALPLVCHYKSGPVRLVGVYPLDEYTEEQARAHGIWNYGGVPLHLADLQEQAEEILGEWMLTPSDILTSQSNQSHSLHPISYHSPLFQ